VTLLQASSFSTSNYQEGKQYISIHATFTIESETKLTITSTGTLSKETINKITKLAYPREQTFFTIMRQSGLTAQALKHLRIRDMEEDIPIPCKINVPQELKQGKFKKYPTFIGEESVKYLKAYLKTRGELSPESFLFASHTIPEGEINTKDVSRAFTLILTKKLNINPIVGKTNRGKINKLTLNSLKKFYKENAEIYLKQLKNHPPTESDESFRKLYKGKAMPYLDIEEQITIELRTNKKRLQRDNKELYAQNVTMKQTIVRDSEYISSVLTLIYNNKGDPETGENEKIGDRFIELWKRTQERELQFLETAWKHPEKVKTIPAIDIVEELTKTLKRILRAYNQAEEPELKH
jgi:hypothetical protein